MKTRNILIALALASACGLVAILLRHPAATVSQGPGQPPGGVLPPSDQRTNQDATATNVPGLSQNLLREVPNALQRLARLEQLGQVPKDADLWDWSLAQKTSWWGKRRDPKTFWKDRVVWLDTSATQAAQRHGRAYPPIPYEDATFASRSDVDVSTLPAADSPDILYRLSDKENAFWDKFVKTHPKPPEYIAGRQAQTAHQILGSHYGFEHAGNPARMTKAELEGSDRTTRRRAQALGYPPEAFTDEALQWTYVLEKRAEYEQQYVQTHTENTLYSSNFLARLWVDPKLVTEPLSDRQLEAGRAWKIAYLQRLRHERTDECYINAYLQAWSLAPADVFGGSNNP
jgi:hypothetical protein